MSNTPVTRDELKQLKIQAAEEKRKAEEEKRQADIEMTVERVYGAIIKAAKETPFTKCMIRISPPGYTRSTQCAYMVNIYVSDDIVAFVLDGIREFFPDSMVAVMVEQPDGKLYDMPLSASPFIQPHTPKFIVVDWS